MTPEPKDKLDAATQVVVSGPEGELLDWRQINWRMVEDQVRRLRQRIFTASRTGDLARVRRLQRLMLRSRSNTLLSVRRVTERNAGRLTAGVDGEVVLTPEAKLELADRVQHQPDTFKALPRDRARDEPVGSDCAAGKRGVRRRRGVGDARVPAARGGKGEHVPARGPARGDRGAIGCGRADR